VQDSPLPVLQRHKFPCIEIASVQPAVAEARIRLQQPLLPALLCARKLSPLMRISMHGRPASDANVARSQEHLFPSSFEKPSVLLWAGNQLEQIEVYVI